MEFDEVREYQPGDDVRSIDWNVTARAGKPFIKKFREERELTVIFLVDLSASGSFGTRKQTKNELAAEICALRFCRHQEQRQGGPDRLHRPGGNVLPPQPRERDTFCASFGRS